MAYDFSIVELKEIQVAGMMNTSDMSNAHKDCPALWHAFGPRIESELAQNADIPPSSKGFGISSMIDENRFEYWAVVPVNSIEKLPEGMKTFTIPAGTYVTCHVPNLEHLGPVYETIYGEWPQSQNDYQIDMQGISIESYSMNWQPSDQLDLYVSIIPK